MITLESIDLTILPSVTLHDLDHLPTTPCIYFAIDSQRVVQYIGRSVNPKARWTLHHRQNEISNLSEVKIAWLEVSDSRLLFSIESALISWFKPPLNKTCLNVSNQIKGMLYLRLRVGKRAEEVAVELGVAVSTVHNWDQLKTAPRMTPMGLQRLMRVYQCTFDELVQAERSANDAKA